MYIVLGLGSVDSFVYIYFRGNNVSLHPYVGVYKSVVFTTQYNLIVHFRLV